MVTKNNSKKDEPEEEKKSEAILALYRKRLTILRLANQHSSQDNLIKAVEGYLEYLNVLAKHHGVKEGELKPALFDLNKDMAEILMISQVYWGLAKAYDRNKRLAAESKRCLDQFVKFSSGFKFQYLNSKMLKKFIKKRMAYNPKFFEEAFKQIQVKSKSCYIATYCFTSPSEEKHLNILREFKDKIVVYKLGYHFIDIYYNTIGPVFITLVERSRFLKLTLTSIIKPVLKVFSFFIDHIFKK